MAQPGKSDNESRKSRLIRMLAPAVQNVARGLIRRAPFAITPEISKARQNALIDHALELGGPPGPVIARKIPTTADGHTWEILIGWERLEAFTHRDAFPRATTIPLGIIDCNSADAAFYAIEHAAPGGGLVIATGNVVQPGSQLENYLAARQATREFGAY